MIFISRTIREAIKIKEHRNFNRNEYHQSFYDVLKKSLSNFFFVIPKSTVLTIILPYEEYDQDMTSNVCIFEVIYLDHSTYINAFIIYIIVIKLYLCRNNKRICINNSCVSLLRNLIDRFFSFCISLTNQNCQISLYNGFY